MYICKYCGKEFEKTYQLAAHVSMCKQNPKYKENLEKRKIKKSKEQIKEERIKKDPYKHEYKEFKLYCQKCGKEYILNLTQKQFDEHKYSKFCSRSCANSRIHSEETKKKISESIKNSSIFYINNREKDIKIYKNINSYLSIEEIPTKICPICKKEYIPKYKFNGYYYKITNFNKYCSSECLHQYKIINFKKINEKYNLGGFKEGSVRNYKSGWYHSIHCDSSWELAFIIYNEEHGNKIERYKEIRHYILEGKEYEYHPDFIVNDKDIYEIKGIKSKNSEAKQLYNKDIKFLYKDNMKLYLDYVINKYGQNFIDLYDKKDKK